MLCFVHLYVEDIFYGVNLYHCISIFYLIQKRLDKKISNNSLETCFSTRCENVFLRDVHLHYQDVYQSEYKVVLFRLDCHIYTCMFYTIHMYVKLWPWHTSLTYPPPHISPHDLQFVLFFDDTCIYWCTFCVWFWIFSDMIALYVENTCWCMFVTIAQYIQKHYYLTILNAVQ